MRLGAIVYGLKNDEQGVIYIIDYDHAHVRWFDAKYSSSIVHYKDIEEHCFSPMDRTPYREWDYDCKVPWIYVSRGPDIGFQRPTGDYSNMGCGAINFHFCSIPSRTSLCKVTRDER